MHMLLQPVPNSYLEWKETKTLNSPRDPQNLATISSMSLKKADLFFFLKVCVSMQNPCSPGKKKKNVSILLLELENQSFVEQIYKGI